MWPGRAWSSARASYGAFNDLCQGEDRTGLRLWALPARRVVQFLESAPSLVRGKNVIELGCGATRRSRAPPCYSARRARSRRTAPSHRRARAAHCAAAQLRFGEPCDAAPGATADLVLGSELLYYNTDLDALVSTIAEQLTIDGVCVLCVVHRVTAARRPWRRAPHPWPCGVRRALQTTMTRTSSTAAPARPVPRRPRWSLFDSAPLPMPVVSDSDDDDDETA